MGGGSSKPKEQKATPSAKKAAQHASKETTSKSSKPKPKKKNASKTKADSMASSDYQMDENSDEFVILHVPPGSNELCCVWLKLDKASGISTPVSNRDTKRINVFKRARNGGGTVEDVDFNEASALELANSCKGSRGIVLICDAMTVEGQALMRYLWARNLWMRTQNSTVIMILPSYSKSSTGFGTTHPSLFGTAFNALTTITVLGLEFGESFLKKGKKTKRQGGSKRSCEARGTRMAFCPRHIWYGQLKDSLVIVKKVLCRFHLRSLIRKTLEEEDADAAVGKGATRRKADEEAAEELQRIQKECLAKRRNSLLRRQASIAAGSAESLNMEAKGDSEEEDDDFLSGFEMNIDEILPHSATDKSEDVNRTSDNAKVSQARHASLATAAARHKRSKANKDGQSLESSRNRPDCETIYLDSDPAFYEAFLSKSFEQLVMHNNAYCDGIPGMHQNNLEKAMGNLNALWNIAWKRSDVDGEVLGEDTSLYVNAAEEVVPVGPPSEFSRRYCKKLPLGDVGTWPSGGLVVIGGGGEVSMHVVLEVGALASPNVTIGKPERRFTTASSNLNSGNYADVMEYSIDEMDAAVKVEKLPSHASLGTGGAGVGGTRHRLSYVTDLKSLKSHKPWTSGECDGLIIFDSADDPSELVKYLEERGKSIVGVDEPSSVILALLIPEASGSTSKWEHVAQVLAAEAIFPCSLVIFLKSGDVERSSSCLASIATCPVDVSAICHHCSPFSGVHHAVCFLATSDSSGEGEVGCLVDMSNLTGGGQGGEMNVYVSFNIYSGPGGFANGFCVEGDGEGCPRRVISQILGETHPLSPVANAGYGISATAPGVENSIWSVIAVVHTIILDIYMRVLQAANDAWSDDELPKLEALGTQRSRWMDIFVTNGNEADDGEI